MIRNTSEAGSSTSGDHAASSAARPGGSGSGPDDDIAVKLSDVSVHFFKKSSRVTAVSKVSMDIPHGSFVALLGPSGCGKSTILNCIAGLQPVTGGGVRCHGKPVSGPNVGIGYMTQRDTLLSWRTVEANIRLPFDMRRAREAGLRRMWAKGTRDSDRERVRHAIDVVGLRSFERHYPRELSGGMLKRAALAQTLAYSQDIILMDEPFGALDAQLKLQMHRELLRVWEEERRTIIFVTHDIEEAVALCDTVFILGARPGRIKEVLQIDLPRPRDPIDIRFDPRFREYHEQIWSLVDAPDVTGVD